MFSPPGGTYCLLDNTDFPVPGSRITVPETNDFQIGDAIVFRDEGGATLPQNAAGTHLQFDTTYYIVGGGAGYDWIQISLTPGGAPIEFATEGGVTVSGALVGNGAEPPMVPAGVFAGGSGYANGEYLNVPLTTVTGSGSGARANITVSGGAVTEIEIIQHGEGYASGDTLSASNGSIGNADPAGTGFLITLTGSEVDDINVDTPNAHVKIEHADFLVVCQVVDWSMDFTREEIDVTTLPCECGEASRWANFRTTVPGPASGTGSMTVLFTPDQTSTANRLIYSSMLQDQFGATIKLYLNYVPDLDSEDCEPDDASSMYIEAPVTLLGFSVSATTTEALSATITFSLAGAPTHMFYTALV